jgi:FixJ family two-component response regulator
VNVREITSDDIDKLRMMLRSSAWSEVVVPTWQARKEILTTLLLQQLSERSDKSMTDDVIRGCIKQLDWDLGTFEKTVGIFDHNQRNEERHAELASP